LPAALLFGSSSRLPAALLFGSSSRLPAALLFGSFKVEGNGQSTCGLYECHSIPGWVLGRAVP
jgi:hypothetical protein